MNKKGFTLVELLAVVAILAILVVFAVPNVIKVYNKSLEESFKTQVKATARSAENYAVLNDTSNIFDCSSFEKGDIFEDCTVTKKNNELLINAVGKGKFDNFLMVDYNKKTGEGQFVNLNNLNTIDTSESVINEDLILPNGEINNFYNVVTASDYFDLFYTKEMYEEEKSTGEFDMGDSFESYRSDFINEVIPELNYTVENNKIVKIDGNSRMYILILINIAKPGKYRFDLGNHREGDEFLPIELLFEESLDENAYFTWNRGYHYGIIDVEFKKTCRFFLSLEVASGEPYLNVSNIYLNGDDFTFLKPNQVSNYVDGGVMFNGTKLTGENNYFTYTNLNDKVGTYKQNYIVKTKKGIQKLSRTIDVDNYTDERCFHFNRHDGSIDDYYDYMDGYISGNENERCPRDVIIPPIIDGVYVNMISESYQYVPSFYNFGSDINTALTSVKIPPTVNEIGSRAFYGNSLTKITIPSSVRIIGSSTFSNNPLTEVIINGAPLGNTMPLTPSIGENAFCSTVDNKWCTN